VQVSSHQYINTGALQYTLINHARHAALYQALIRLSSPPHHLVQPFNQSVEEKTCRSTDLEIIAKGNYITGKIKEN